MKKYLFNLETTKIELHFDKSEYIALSNEQKSKLKGGYLFSGKNKCWVSRAKEPNLYRAKQIANELGFTGEERTGERLAYAEQLEQKSERAEERAERFEQYANNAEKRAENLQSEFNHVRGDIAYMTQPIINGHSGSARFAKQRERVFAKYDKGFEEYKKSDYYKNRAEKARNAASNAKLDDLGYLNRKVNECKKTIKVRSGYVNNYLQKLENAENGKNYKRYDGSFITTKEIEQMIEREIELIEVEIDKQAFFENRIGDLGGIKFSKDNIKVGYIVDVKHYGEVEVLSTGAKNIKYNSMCGFALTASYAEINSIVKAEEKKSESQPFKVGEVFKGSEYDTETRSFKSYDYEIVKATDKTISLKKVGSDEKPKTKKPRKRPNGEWCISVGDLSRDFYCRKQTS